MDSLTLQRTVPLTLILLGLSGCISDPKYVEEEFGLSVKQMVEAQIYDPAAASNPLAAPPELIDGTAASESILGYREESKRETGSDQGGGLNIQID